MERHLPDSASSVGYIERNPDVSTKSLVPYSLILPSLPSHAKGLPFLPHPPIKKPRANKRTSFMGGSESEERAFRGGRRSSPEESLNHIHLLDLTHPSVRLLAHPSTQLFPTLPLKNFARTKERHSWEGRKARNELSGEGGVHLPKRV